MIQESGKIGKEGTFVIQAALRKRALMMLPLDGRRALMEEQAQVLAQYYAENQQWKVTEGGDFIEY